MKKDYLLLLGVFAVIVVLGAYVLFAQPASDLEYRPIDVGGGSITVENQPDDLAIVTLDAELAAPGWITIHESLASAPAAIIGTSVYMEAGVYDDFVIQLAEPMNPGFRYITLLHADNGDKEFVVLDDLPVEVNGTVVRPDFVAGKEPGDDSTIVDIPGTDETIELTPEETEE